MTSALIGALLVVLAGLAGAGFGFIALFGVGNAAGMPSAYWETHPRHLGIGAIAGAALAILGLVLLLKYGAGID